MSTDREWVTDLVLAFAPMLESPVLRRLQEAVAYAQNAPPQGTADGSLTQAKWEAARDVADSLQAAQTAARKLLG